MVSYASRSIQRRPLTQLRLLYVSNCLVKACFGSYYHCKLYVCRSIHVLVMSGDKQSVLDWLNLCPAQSEGIICKRSKEQKIIARTFIICTCLIKTLYLWWLILFYSKILLKISMTCINEKYGIFLSPKTSILHDLRFELIHNKIYIQKDF